MLLTCINCVFLVIYLATFILARTKYSNTLLENQLLKKQLVIMSRVWKSKIHSKHISNQEREDIARLAHKLHFKKGCIYLAHVDTIRAWFRKFISPIFKTGSKTGRPRIPDSVKLLVYRFRKYNKWGYRKIAGEINKLGYELSKSSIPHILNTFRPPHKGRRFSLAKLAHIFAMDFAVHYNHLGDKFFTLLFINHKTREIVHVRNCQGEPSKQWIENQLKEITSDDKPVTLIHDNDVKFKYIDFEKYNISNEPIRAHSPNHNAIVERAIKSFKNEAMYHYPAYNLKKLNWITKEYCTYYNNHRPHQGIGNITIPQYKEQLKGKERILARDIYNPGTLHTRRFLGGHLVHHYYKSA